MNNRYSDDFEKSFKKRKGSSIEVLLALVLVWAVLATLFCVYLILYGDNVSREALEVENSATEIFLTEEQEGENLIIKKDARTEFLAELKDKMLTGNGSVAMLREFFPDEIIYLKKGEYNFFPISETLMKNPYENLEFHQDEETKIIEGYDNMTLVSRFGIDVSKHNGEIDWETLKMTDVDFAIIRLGFRGYGTGELALDEQYLNNVEGAKRVGIDYGVYFFTQAISEEEAVEEAEFLLENIEGYELSFPIVFDVEVLDISDVRTENLTKEERTDFCIAFCERIEEAGYETMIYGNIITFMEMLDKTRLEEYKKWFAFYNDTIYYPYDFDIWQYSESGILDGINENVDFNIIFDKERIIEP